MSWIDAIRSALDDFTKPGRTLELALSQPGATPEELGAAVRAIFGLPEPGKRPVDCLEAAERLRGRLEGLAMGMRDGLRVQLHEFEQLVAAQLRGKTEDQKRAGLVLTSEFTRFGRSPHGHVLAGTPWGDLVPVGERYQSGGNWLVLGWPRGNSPRPFYRIEDVIRYTKLLEAERRQLQFEHDQEHRRRDEASRRAWEQSDAGRIAALEAELAKLKGRPAA